MILSALLAWIVSRPLSKHSNLYSTFLAGFKYIRLSLVQEHISIHMQSNCPSVNLFFPLCNNAGLLIEEYLVD